jgi:hypothetical protein
MQTDITRCAWKRRGAAHCIRRPVCTREHRQFGFIGPNAAKLRRFMKCRRHRHARRTVRAGLRAYAAWNNHPLLDSEQSMTLPSRAAVACSH